MMMNFDDPLVGGNSQSILSALAPPFSTNPNPNSNAISDYSNSPYSAQPYYDAWKYPLPSTSASELFMDSIGGSSAPLLDAYQFSATESASPSSSFAFGGEVDSYPSYSPFGDHSLEVSRDKVVPSCAEAQLDGAQRSIDWGYGPKRVKTLQLDANLQGGLHSMKNRKTYGEESGFPYQKFNEDYDRGFHTGSLNVEPMKDKPSPEQISFFSYDANKTGGIASSSTFYPKSHSSALSCDIPKNFSGYQYYKPVQTAFAGPLSMSRASPDVNSGRSLASCEVSADFVDPPNPPVDSPCWKGATQFDLEANCKYVETILDEFSGFGHKEHQNLHSTFDFDGVLPEQNDEIYQNHQSEFAKDTLLMLDRAFRDWFLTPAGCKGVGIGCTPQKKDSALLNSLSTSFDEESTRITANDASESGAVAILVAEKVLASPISHAFEVECPKPDLKLHVQLMIKTMQNLSEMLLFHLSTDVFSLEEEHSESLKRTINNLDLCFNEKSFLEPKKPVPNNIVGSTSKNSCQDQSSAVGTISESSHTVNEAINSLSIPHSEHVHQKDSLSGKKDDLDIATNDTTAKALKKVLEENLHFAEEMSSLALPFKNMWHEAEAKLSSISYKSRFDRMKTQIEAIKQKDQEMMSKVSISPGMITASEVVHETDDETIPKHTSKNLFNSGLSELADDILKCQEDELRDEEEEQKPDGELSARISREDNSNLISTGEAKPEMVGGGFASERNVVPLCITDHSENATLDLVLKPVSQGQNDSLSEDGSYVDVAGCESLDEFYIAVPDPAMVNQHDAVGYDSPSSDWEHVLKDEL